jgi:hypothetical protein
MPIKFGRFYIAREPESLQERTELEHCFIHSTSFICAKYLFKERGLQVLRSAAGFYIGVRAGIEDNIPGEPLSRDSQDYYRTQEDAQFALTTRTWVQRLNP